jgi:hypothetical protein
MTNTQDAWMGEVVAFAQVLSHEGMLKAIADSFSSR